MLFVQRIMQWALGLPLAFQRSIWIPHLIKSDLLPVKVREIKNEYTHGNGGFSHTGYKLILPYNNE